MADTCSCPGMDVFRLRVVIAEISPLIWRRLEVAAGTTVAGLHAIVQAVFGWSGEHLHRFAIGGTEYGISCPGGPGFRDDARQVGHPRCAGRAGVTRRLREAFAGPAPLLAGAAQAGDPLATLPALFHLMWRQELVADVTAERLGPATQVRAAAAGR
jgi:hypothetical protein